MATTAKKKKAAARKKTVAKKTTAAARGRGRRASSSPAKLPKNVLLAVPSYDSKVHVRFVNAFMQAAFHCSQLGISVSPLFMCNDSLVQRARNDLFKAAVEGNFDAMVFIDGDIEFAPEWLAGLLMSPRDVVGGAARKKTDDAELYNVKTSNYELEEDGLIEVDGVGCGFVKLSRKAIQALWKASPLYENGGRSSRMVCNVDVIDGELYSEDTMLHRKLQDLGFKIFLNPKMTCNHIGEKVYPGNIEAYIQRLKGEEPDGA